VWESAAVGRRRPGRCDRARRERYATLRALPAGGGRDLDDLDRRAHRILERWIEQAAARPAPTAFLSLPADLDAPGPAHFGVYREGWLEQESARMLRRGSAARSSSALRSLPRDDGASSSSSTAARKHRPWSRRGRPLELRVRVPAARDLRVVELR
jgi:hypothetical protein